MEKVTFYFFPTSFYSQKARLSLEEKGIPYKPVYIPLTDNGQNQAWYLKLNPNGTVPVLTIGDQCYNQSEEIIDVVDALPSNTPWKLVPDSSTVTGKLVSHWREKIDSIQIPIITFGVAAYPELSPGGLDGMAVALRPSRLSIKNRFEGSIKTMEKVKSDNPDLAETCDVKIDQYKQRLIDFFDKDKIAAELDSIDIKMGEIEQQLQHSALNGGDYFLCGPSFTAADISVCVMFGRFKMLGLLPRFANPGKHPLLSEYWERVQQRPAVKKVVVNNLVETTKYLLYRKLKRFAGVGVAVGVAGVAVWVAYRYLKK